MLLNNSGRKGPYLLKTDSAEVEPILGEGRAQEIPTLCGPGSYADLRDHLVVAFMG